MSSGPVDGVRFVPGAARDLTALTLNMLIYRGHMRDLFKILLALVSLSLLQPAWAIAGYPSFQALIDATEAGGLLSPPAGTYAGPAVISQPIIIDGRGVVTVDAGGTGSVLSLETDGATIKNLRLVNSGESHNDVDSAVLVKGNFNVIKNNVIENTLFGIDLSQSANNIVRGNRISSKDFELGVRGDAIRLWYSFNNKVTDNVIRNSRDTTNPSVTEHARMCIAAGADGITVHPRPDQRHIRAQDCFELAAMLAVEFNIEGNPMAGPRRSDRTGVSDYPGFMELVREIRPAQCTLVPDGDDQLTSDHGFDLKRDGDTVAPLVADLKALGIRTSLFMDPEPEQIRLAAQVGADRIELYTERYARAFAGDNMIEAVFRQFVLAAETAAEEGLGLNAGHDLNLLNLPRFATVPGLLEVSIGHALTVDAIRMGLANAVAASQRALGK